MSKHDKFLGFVIEFRNVQGVYLGEMSVGQFMYSVEASKTESVADAIKRYNLLMKGSVKLVMRTKG